MKRRACVVVASELTLRAFLARQLQAMERHYDLTVVANTANLDLLRELGVNATLRPLAIARPVSLLDDLRAFVQLVRLMRAHRFDLVHSMTPKAGLLAMAAAWLTRVPVRVHTFTGQIWATRSGLPRALFKRLDRVMAACATFSLADSASQREFLISEGIVPAAKVLVLGRGSVSGVDTARFRPDPDVRCSLRRQMQIAPADVVLLFVGRLHRDKGILDLARAFAVLADERSDVRLVIVGPDEQDLRAALLEICARHTARVHCLDYTPAPEMVMAACDVLCLPSYREGFGSVIIEAAAVGLPAVASRIYGIVDAVEEGQTGLLHSPGDVAGLLEQLRRITSNRSLLASLGARARARAIGEFSQTRVTAALLGVYAGLLSSRPQGWYRRWGKRASDVVLAGVALVLLLPLAASVAVLVRVCLGSPVLFRQFRPGLGGVPFELVKFRSMAEQYDRDGRRLPDGERLTSLGRIIRAASLDEIPELWSVLKGDMSLVGPRPLLLDYLPRYTAAQSRRHDVRPGITGLAQVHGRNDLAWEDKFALDLRYVDECSLFQDLRILALTIVQVLAQRGINQRGHATAEEFMGRPTEARE